jgi:hypothetical protein
MTKVFPDRSAWDKFTILCELVVRLHGVLQQIESLREDGEGDVNQGV